MKKRNSLARRRHRPGGPPTLTGLRNLRASRPAPGGCQPGLAIIGCHRSALATKVHCPALQA